MGAPWPGRRRKAKFTGDGGDAIQAKEKKPGQGISMKSLKGANFEEELQGNGSKCCTMTKERVHSSKAQDGPRHGAKQPKAPGKGSKS